MTRAFTRLLLALGLAGCGPLSTSASRSLFAHDSMQLLVRRTDPVPSQELKDRYAGQHLNGDYEIKTDADGQVTAVSVVRSIPDCDEMVIDHLRHFRLASPPSIMHVEVVFALPTPAGSQSAYRALPWSRRGTRTPWRSRHSCVGSSSLPASAFAASCAWPSTFDTEAECDALQLLRWLGTRSRPGDVRSRCLR
jgi:hypothetical protein